MVNYKFNEGALIQDLQKYVDSTYDSHYSKNKFQSTEFIIDSGHGMGFALGNVLKYAQRYGHKDGTNRKDLMKILHYALIALHCHDEEHNEDLQIDLDFLSDSYDNNNTINIGSISTEPAFSTSAIYNIDNMMYNYTYDVPTGYVPTDISLEGGKTLDDATPEEWNTASKNANRKTKK